MIFLFLNKNILPLHMSYYPGGEMVDTLVSGTSDRKVV